MDAPGFADDPPLLVLTSQAAAAAPTLEEAAQNRSPPPPLHVAFTVPGEQDAGVSGASPAGLAQTTPPLSPREPAEAQGHAGSPHPRTGEATQPGPRVDAEPGHTLAHMRTNNSARTPAAPWQSATSIGRGGWRYH